MIYNRIICPIAHGIERKRALLGLFGPARPVSPAPKQPPNLSAPELTVLHSLP